jgi:hypothetical protein
MSGSLLFIGLSNRDSTDWTGRQSPHFLSSVAPLVDSLNERCVSESGQTIINQPPASLALHLSQIPLAILRL